METGDLTCALKEHMAEIFSKHYPDGQEFTEYSYVHKGKILTFTHEFVTLDDSHQMVGCGYFNPVEDICSTL